MNLLNNEKSYKQKSQTFVRIARYGFCLINSAIIEEVEN